MPKNRSQINANFKWHLEDICPSNERWEEIFEEIKASIPEFSKYSGKLNDDDMLLECLQKCTKVGHDLSHIYQYAHMRKDEDTRVSMYQAMDNRVDQLGVMLSSAQSFIMPEINELSVEKLEALANDKKFEDYSLLFKHIIRDKAKILSKAEESILSEIGSFAGTPSNVFSMFDNADIKFKPVMVDGKEVEMSHGMYSVLMMNENRDVRKAAFESMFNAFKDHINTLAAVYDGNCKTDWFYAKIRKFNTCMDASLYYEEVPSVCYENLIKAVNSGTKALHKYIDYKCKVLGVKDPEMYDIYVPLIQSQNVKYSYKNAVYLVKSALKVMGKEYSDILASAFEEGWIDVYENKGKRSGAYSWGCYGVHPFVLLNFNGTTHDVFTIAHELGHSMHSYYSNLNQCEEKADYKIFVAEIASTVNEVLLLKHLLKSAKGDMRKYLLCYYLEMFRTTLFRQTQFAEFELIAHTAVEKGIPLTAEYLSDEYYKLNKKYYGAKISSDLIKYEWARIPHFYTSFYVYKYATGITAAVSIATNLLKYGEKYFEKYKKFLSAGCTLPPLEILKLADVDLTSEEPFKKAMKEFADTLNELMKDE